MGTKQEANSNDYVDGKAMGNISLWQSSCSFCAESVYISPKTAKAISSPQKAWALDPSMKVQLGKEGKAMNVSIDCLEESIAGDLPSAEERSLTRRNKPSLRRISPCFCLTSDYFLSIYIIMFMALYKHPFLCLCG
jgi:hypothetical protein